MNSKSRIRVLIGIACIIAIFLLLKNTSHIFHKNHAVPVPDSVLFVSAPVLSPEQALHTFKLPEGFKIELVASEPLIKDPIAMTFDEQGRIWVVEMQSYMIDVHGSGEDGAESRIVILEDKDGDGKMDNAKVFMEGLGMPRAIALVEDGLLYADPPNLWFVENIEDKPGKKILIDSLYAVGGNAEHQPNGLMRGIDNWYYNAKSKARYKYKNKEWIKEETEFRGQWGITKDDFGRLFYNTNSNQLRGDLVPPNKLNRNPDFNATLGINAQFAADQRVYPIRPTPGVNRGYQDWVLDPESRLKAFTAACSPLVYRGNNFPDTFSGNVFVCEPAGNLIKRNILKENGLYVEAVNAYNDREFLASTDERFRPVSLYNAPDGAMYIVDMYKGIIQHEVFLTEYLRGEIESRGLEKPLGMGRIYRVVYEGNWWNKIVNKFKFPERPNLKQANDQLLMQYLSHPNGWWRDNAQRLLVERNNKSTISEITDLLRTNKSTSLGKLHALWTLEGMEVFTPDIVALGIKDEEVKVVEAALRIGENNSSNDQAKAVLDIYEQVLQGQASSMRLQLQLALSLGDFMSVDAERVMDMLATIAITNEGEPLIREAVMSSLKGKEEQFLALLQERSPGSHVMIAFLMDSMDKATIKHHLRDKALSKAEKEQYVLGKSLYEKTCASCHHENGEGLVPVAPPLVESEWVEGTEERLVLIVLHGMEGPVTVKKKVYKTPEVQPVMPGLKDNPDFTDEKIAALLTYIRNAWTNNASAVKVDKVSAVRKHYMDRNKPFTEEELLRLPIE